ncbi:MAG: cytochrome c oxidase subunit 3 [Chitinophagales bacterium]|nr:cytochrome c oxidase subunit 3 [Chitinophagales bacterium]MDW8418188.1 cytochrome c oxidase subunit 3 [Chitinophagales bacterium]
MDVFVPDKKYLKEKTEYTGIHPQKFALWLGMASMAMFFAALTSALLVKKGDYQTWENFRLPWIFALSTVAVITVSILMHFSLRSYRNGKFQSFRFLLAAAFAMGVVFLILQYAGWKILTAMGMPITGNISGQFVYVISAAHGLHIVAGLIVTLFFLVNAFRTRNDPLFELRNIINPKRLLNMEMLTSFWHFIDGVWVYLYIFFLLNYH